MDDNDDLMPTDDFFSMLDSPCPASDEDDEFDVWKSKKNKKNKKNKRNRQMFKSELAERTATANDHSARKHKASRAKPKKPILKKKSVVEQEEEYFMTIWRALADVCPALRLLAEKTLPPPAVAVAVHRDIGWLSDALMEALPDGPVRRAVRNLREVRNKIAHIAEDKRRLATAVFTRMAKSIPKDIETLGVLPASEIARVKSRLPA